jgi:putative endonuclease
MSTWSVYILLCSDGSLYTGATTDVQRRFEEHQQGRASKCTRSRLPVKLMYVRGGLTQSQALKEEARLKALPRPEKVQMVDSYHDGHKEGDFCLSSKPPASSKS